MKRRILTIGLVFALAGVFAYQKLVEALGLAHAAGTGMPA